MRGLCGVSLNLLVLQWWIWRVASSCRLCLNINLRNCWIQAINIDCCIQTFTLAITLSQYDTRMSNDHTVQYIIANRYPLQNVTSQNVTCHKTSPVAKRHQYKTSPHKTSPHKTSPVRKRQQSQNVTSHKTSPSVLYNTSVNFILLKHFFFSFIFLLPFTV